MKRPKLCYEQHKAARPVLCQALHKTPHLPGSGVCSLTLRLGPGDAGTLTAAAASCAGSPWLPPLVGRSAPGSGKSVGDQEDGRQPLGPQLSLVPGRPQRGIRSRDCDAQSTHKGVGRGQKAGGPRPGDHSDSWDRTVSLSPDLVSQTPGLLDKGPLC